MWNDWLKAPTYLWVESLVSSMSETTWKNEVTVEVKDEPISGSWAAKAQFCKAARCYAVEKGLYVKDVTREMIEATALGIRGYAELYASTPAAFPQPGGDGSASRNTSSSKPPGTAPAPAPTAKGKAGKRKEQVTSPDLQAVVSGGQAKATEENDADTQPEQKKPKKGGAGGNVTSKKERELKEFLALEAHSDNCMTAIAADMSANPASWGWAKEFVQQYKSLRTEILQLYADTKFFKEAKVAALSAKETSRLRKAYGLDYHSKLCEFCLQLGPKISSMGECTSKIRQMADAQATAVASVAGTPSKPSKASTRKPTRLASQASLSA